MIVMIMIIILVIIAVSVGPSEAALQTLHRRLWMRTRASGCGAG